MLPVDVTLTFSHIVSDSFSLLDTNFLIFHFMFTFIKEVRLEIKSLFYITSLSRRTCKIHTAVLCLDLKSRQKQWQQLLTMLPGLAKGTWVMNAGKCMLKTVLYLIR